MPLIFVQVQFSLLHFHSSGRTEICLGGGEGYWHERLRSRRLSAEASACEGQEWGGGGVSGSQIDAWDKYVQYLQVVSNVVDGQTDRLITTHVCMHAGQ